MVANIPNTGYSRATAYLIRPYYDKFQIPPITSNLGLLGKVKTVKYEDGRIYEFNEDGQLTKHHSIYEGTTDSKTAIYTYNEKKQHATIAFSFSAQKERNCKYAYAYGKQGKITQCYTSGTDTTYYQITADEIYSTLHPKKTNAVGLITAIGRTRLEYDGRKRLVKIIGPKNTETRRFNEDNTLSTLKISGETEINVTFRYDPNGKWIRITGTKGDRTYVNRLIRLEFDINGNWTSMEINKGKPFGKTYTRTITYY